MSVNKSRKTVDKAICSLVELLFGLSDDPGFFEGETGFISSGDWLFCCQVSDGKQGAVVSLNYNLELEIHKSLFME